MKPPTSGIELMALPERERFSFETRIIDGKTVKVPVAHKFDCIYMKEDTVYATWDSDGQEWRLAHDADGYCRVRHW